MVVGGGVAAEKQLTRRQLAMRWGLGLCCLVVEVALAVLIISTCSRHFTDQFFLWHPILMCIGALLCLSHGVRVYTALAGISRWKMRLTHAFLSVFWVIFSMAGLVIVERHKFTQALPIFNTVHGRLGLGVLFLSLVQGMAGTLKLFVLHRTNQRFLRWHGRLGTLIYASSLTAVLTGVYAQLDSLERSTMIAVYTLTFVLAVMVIFFDFIVKGGDLVPHPPLLSPNERRIKILDSTLAHHNHHPIYSSLDRSLNLNS